MTHPKSQAFTLIELLVVMVIIAIITTVAVLSIGGLGKSRQLSAFSKRLTATIPVAEQQAILQPAVLGLQMTNDSYRFYYFKIDHKTDKGSWHTYGPDSTLGLTKIPSNISVKIVSETKLLPYSDDTTQINLLFLPSGNITPFKIYLGLKGELTKYIITGKADGTITIKRNNEN